MNCTAHGFEFLRKKKGENIMSNLITKFFAVVSAIVLFFTVPGGATLNKTGEYSTKLTQQTAVESKTPKTLSLYEFFSKTEKGFTIPGLLEGFVPQGLFYQEQNDLFLISGYYKDKSCTSRIVVVNGEGEFVKSVGLISENGKRVYGHFGGIAAFGDNVYVASTTLVYAVSLSEILSLEDDGYAQTKKELYPDVRCSYVNVCGGVMYVGEYIDITYDAMANAKFKATSKAGEKFYARCNGYILDENGFCGLKDGYIDEEGNITPDFAFESPLKCQGMARLPDGRVVFTASATNVTNSNIYLFKDVTQGEADFTDTVNGKEVPVYLCVLCDRIKLIKAPTLLEEVTVYKDGSVYFITESGADPYRDNNTIPLDYVLHYKGF